MIDHLGIVCTDFPRSAQFYDVVLASLGYTRAQEFDHHIGYGADGRATFWISTSPDAGPGPEVHLAFSASSPEAVQAFFDAGLSVGAEPLHEPRPWPEYEEGYFAAFLRDPDGNNIEAVYHTVES